VAVGPELITTNRGSVGFMLDAGVRYRWLSAAIEAHGSPPLGATLGDHTVNFARLTGALLLCLHLFEPLFGCAKGETGKLLFPGSPNLAALAYDAAGGRIGLEQRVRPWFSIRMAVDVLGTINPPVVWRYTTQQPVFQLAGINVGLGLGALWAWEPEARRAARRPEGTTRIMNRQSPHRAAD
jgi:hypothetical protein